MINKVSSILPKVNFFDGQRITESDLDSEQLYNESITSGIINDFHGSGVVRDYLFENKILLDTSLPGFYTTIDNPNPSKEDIEFGEYDGKPIFLDIQPSDSTYGSRLEVELSDSNVSASFPVKIIIVGYTYSSLEDKGEVVIESLQFVKNTSLLTKYAYKEVLSVMFNNFSGGTGKTEILTSADNEKNLGKIVFREAEPLKVYPKPVSLSQTESPNFDLNNFITYSELVSISDLLKEAIGASVNFSDLYLELSPSETFSFEESGLITTSFGQKFLAKSNNLQRIDLLMSVTKDETATSGNEYDFSGDLVLSIYPLSTTVDVGGVSPDKLIDFDPEIEPIAEVSYNQSDLADAGIFLNENPTVVSFNFADTLIADPSLDNGIVSGSYYCFVLSRRGDNKTGAVNLICGWDKPYRKESNGQTLNPLERFATQETRFFLFDTATKRYVDYRNYSLWHKIYSDVIEVTPGTAYSEDSHLITIDKTVEYVGDTKIINYIDNIPLVSVGFGANNYIVLNRKQEFITPVTHPRTGNLVYSRIYNTGAIESITEDYLASIKDTSAPLLLSRVSDFNARSATEVSGSFDRPGLVLPNKILFINPSSEILNQNLVDRIIIPDTECNCSATYKIIKSKCKTYYVGDLNRDSKITTTDISELVSLLGNTINSSITEKKILGGLIDIISFTQSDLNGDKTIDGTDLELLEDAVEGDINFSVPETFQVLEIEVDNISRDNDYPEILSGSDGTTLFETSEITFVASDYRDALIIRIGDKVSIAGGGTDDGIYRITSKAISSDDVTVTLTLENEDGSIPAFDGFSGQEFSIVSGTRSNMLIDNKKLLNVPFESTSYKIIYSNIAYNPSFVEACDLRRFVSRNFIEEKTEDPCLCQPDDCGTPAPCEPVYKNQQFVSGDIYLPDGEIYSSPGIPYHGDFELINIRMPLPPGTIEDCQVNLYDTFVKAVSGTCKTAAGYDALRYSDGTLVGCEDDGLDNDIAKGRVKFSSAIASLYVDSLIEGNAVDGYSDETSTSANTHAIKESFKDVSYDSFSSWSEDATSDLGIFSISHLSGANQPANISVTTISTSGIRNATLNGPAEISSMTGDLLFDFRMTRLIWDSASILGVIKAGIKLNITNDDGGTSTLNLGWEQTATNSTKVVWDGIIKDSFGTTISSFSYKIDAPDEIGDDILFRIRRIDDTIFAYYIIPTAISEDVDFGQFIRIGENPDIQPGSGTVSASFEMVQGSFPAVGLDYSVSLKDAIFRYDYSTESTSNSVDISRDSSSLEINRVALAFPIKITPKTNVISASLVMTAAADFSTTDLFNVIPLQIINADNLSIYYNYPTIQDDSLITTFSPGTVTSGSTFEVDITTIVNKFISDTGFLPGYYKAIIIEPDASSNSLFSISGIVTLNIEYEDITTGIIFKVGVSIDPETGIASFKTKNILYDSLNQENRTIINFGVYLKKSGFRNKDVSLNISDLKKIGLGTCYDPDLLLVPGETCYFIVDTTGVGTFIEGPFDCVYTLP